MCVILQSVDAGLDFDSEEVLTTDMYGTGLVLLTLSFIPITVYFLYTGIRDDASWEGSPPIETAVEFKNPIGLDYD